MKQKKYIALLLVAFFTLAAMWGIPSLVRKATYKPDSYPFMYYSSILEELCFVDFANKSEPLRDMSGKVYNQSQFDSIMPMLNYRQLNSDGRLPDSIAGYAVDVRMLRMHNIVYRYVPPHINTPSIDLHLMYESMPKRIGLEVPSDVFRLRERIEFIDAETNTADEEKSLRFNAELEKKEFTFPARHVWGNPNPRKAYDEGHFCLDDAGALYHIKMVNGRPFVKDTKVGESIDVAFFSMQEVATKRFYGYIYDREGYVYILEAEEGGYKLLKLDMPPLDLAHDRMTIMGNLLYWTVTVTRPDGMDCYALDCNTLKRVADYHADREAGMWNKVSEWLFPCYLTFTDRDSYYIEPHLHFTGFKAFGLNIVLALGLLIFCRRQRRNSLYGALYVAVTGICGLLALTMLPGMLKKK